MCRPAEGPQHPASMKEAIVFLQRWLSPRPATDAPEELRQSVSRLASLGREHLLAARSARDQRLAASASSLYGDAIARFSEAKALLAPADSQAALAPADPASVLIATAPDKASTEQGEDALVLLRDPQKASTLSSGRKSRALALLELVGVRLSAGLYPTSDAEVRSLRTKRQVGTALALALGLAAFGCWLVAPHNVARGKPVTASSVRFGTPQALVNGAIEWGTFGLHTGGSGREWATIDLVKFYSLTSAEIYPRGEGRFEFNLPLHVELSADGTNFREAGACKDLFTQATPCLVDLHHERARFVRVSAPEVVLAEVEVYGKP